MSEPRNYAQMAFGNGQVLEYTIKRTLVKDGLVMPGLPGFKSLGNGVTTCYYCNRPLTDELSHARGCGPECVVRYGPCPGKEWVEEYAKRFASYQRKQEKLMLPVSNFDVWFTPFKAIAANEKH
jgi:hypothetical protein